MALQRREIALTIDKRLSDGFVLGDKKKMEWETSEHAKEGTGLTAAERIASLFQPDTLLAAHYFANLRRRTLLEPEKRLMLAVLEDAIHCFQDHLLTASGRKRRVFKEAQEWITEMSADWIFSFENVCETLGLNPAYVRQGLLQWKEKKLAGSANSKSLERKRMAG
jgi:hypothetical protein